MFEKLVNIIGHLHRYVKSNRLEEKTIITLSHGSDHDPVYSLLFGTPEVWAASVSSLSAGLSDLPAVVCETLDKSIEGMVMRTYTSIHGHDQSRNPPGLFAAEE